MEELRQRGRGQKAQGGEERRSREREKERNRAMRETVDNREGNERLRAFYPSPVSLLGQKDIDRRKRRK